MNESTIKNKNKGKLISLQFLCNNCNGDGSFILEAYEHGKNFNLTNFRCLYCNKKGVVISNLKIKLFQ
jgi:hypothetical protein